jgi:Allophanate hydrolase subunit 1
MRIDDINIIDYGDSGILVEFSKTYTEEAWYKAHYLSNQLRNQGIKGVTGIIPTFSSVFIDFNVLLVDRQFLKETINGIIETVPDVANAQAMRSQRFRVPVVFGGEMGPDIANVAAQIDISEEQVVNQFCFKPYKIICLVRGPMMDAPVFGKKIRRLPTPRTQVPAGSVCVAGSNASIYTVNSPGGWQLLGRTPIQIANFANDPPVPYRPGDYLEFFPIKEEEFNLYERQTLSEMQVEI